MKHLLPIHSDAETILFVRADETLAAFVEPESAIHAGASVWYIAS